MIIRQNGWQLFVCVIVLYDAWQDAGGEAATAPLIRLSRRRKEGGKGWRGEAERKDREQRKEMDEEEKGAKRKGGRLRFL